MTSVGSLRRPSPSLSSFLSHPRRTAPASSPIVILALSRALEHMEAKVIPKQRVC
jgi:hypothetical protein